MATSESSLLDEMTMIDTDFHVSISTDEVGKYCEEPFRGHMLNSVGSPLPQDGWDTYLGGKIEKRRIATPKDVIETCEEHNLDYPILNCHTKITRLPKSRLAVHLMKAYNDAIVANFLDPLDDAYGLINLTTHEPDKAAEEIDRWGDETQVIGAYIVNAGPETPLGDPRYDVMYQAAEDNDFTIVFHSSAGGFTYDFPIQNRSLEEYLEVNTLCHIYSHLLTATSLVVQGVPVKFPDVNFVFLEAGQGWIPSLMYRLNKTYYMRRSEAPLLEKTPEEYMREFYYGSQPLDEPNDPEHLRDLVRMIGTDSMMFSSDVPHWNFDNPATVDKYFSHFTQEERSQIFYENASEAFGITP